MGRPSTSTTQSWRGCVTARLNHFGASILGLIPSARPGSHRPHRNWHVAEFDMTGLNVEPLLVPIAARLNQVLKNRRVRPHDLQGAALGHGHVRREAN